MTNLALSVPPITLREHIPYAAIDDVAKQIVKHFHPKQIILFGSYAYGKPHQESDVDLLIVMDTSLSEIQQAIEILKTIEYRFGLDLLVYTPQRLSQRLEWGDPFVKEIITRGKVLYESTNS